MMDEEVVGQWKGSAGIPFQAPPTQKPRHTPCSAQIFMVSFRSAAGTTYQTPAYLNTAYFICISKCVYSGVSPALFRDQDGQPC